LACASAEAEETLAAAFLRAACALAKALFLAGVNPALTQLALPLAIARAFLDNGIIQFSLNFASLSLGGNGLDATLGVVLIPPLASVLPALDRITLLPTGFAQLGHQINRTQFIFVFRHDVLSPWCVII
jgi:hypothetical protein